MHRQIDDNNNGKINDYAYILYSLPFLRFIQQLDVYRYAKSAGQTD